MAIQQNITKRCGQLVLARSVKCFAVVPFLDDIGRLDFVGWKLSCSNHQKLKDSSFHHCNPDLGA